MNHLITVKEKHIHSEIQITDGKDKTRPGLFPGSVLLHMTLRLGMKMKRKHTEDRLKLKFWKKETQDPKSPPQPTTAQSRLDDD